MAHREFINIKGLNKSLQAGRSLTAVGLLSFLLVLAGSGMQGYANKTFDSFTVALFLFIIGVVLVGIIFPGKKKFETRAFLLSYGICIFVGGLAQCYSLWVFGIVQSTTDSIHAFFPLIASQPPFITFKNIPPNFNSPLALLIWQQVYKIAWLLNVQFGPYTAVMFNAFIIGLSGSLTVRTARELFGNDAWRLKRVGTFFAVCGLFILFGSILLRDCFTTFLNILVLWSLVKWSTRPNRYNLLFSFITTCISAYAMSFLRLQSVLLFGLFGVMAFLFWILAKQINIARLILVLVVICVVVLASPFIMSYMNNIRETQSEGLENYAEHASVYYSEKSLGMRLIVNQPLPIRLLLGSGNFMIAPIPLWNNFKSTSREYLLIKGYHGIYQVIILPLVFAGYFIAFKIFRADRRHAIPLLFVGSYFLMNLLAVVATSMEQRHIAQYMPALIILAALPDTRNTQTKKIVQRIAVWWFLVVFFIHLAWAIMKRVI